MTDTYAKLGYSTTITIGGNTIAEVVSISGPNVSKDMVDVTTMDSSNSYRDFIPNLKDGGEVSIELKFYPNDTNGQAALLTAFEDSTKDTYVITFPTSMGASWTFSAYVTEHGNEIPLDDAIGLAITLKISGKPTLGTTASTGASAFALRDSGDSADATAFAITPAWAIGTYFYAATFTTDASVYPKLTAASHTIELYIDGTYVESLTSGSVGSAITFSAGEVKELKFIVWEDNKTALTYTVMVTRTS